MINKDSLLNRLGIASLALGIGLSGCGGNDNNAPVYVEGTRNGFEVSSIDEGNRFRVVVKDTTNIQEMTYVGGLLDKETGNFRDIYIGQFLGRDLPQTHPIFTYANPESLKAVNEQLRGTK